MAEGGPLAGKRVLLGVSGGIAAYKALEVVRQLTQRGADVHVAMTHTATRFVGPLSFATLSRQRVLTDVLELDGDSSIVHVELGRSVDLIVVAPATCNMIGRLAYGLAEDAISATVLASPAPLLVVPAMDHHMWLHPATQENLAALDRRGVHVLPPVHGPLASGASGWGRMREPAEIAAAVERLLAPGSLAGRHVVVTAGGTQEPIDPVRFVGNHSTGKMGVAVAEVARDRGARVTFVHAAMAVAVPHGVALRPAATAAAMAAAIQELASQADALVMAAAVADFRPATPASHKIKKQSAAGLSLQLEPTLDILASLSTLQLVKIGFAAETEQLHDHARAKLRDKKLDLIVANDVTTEGSGFGTDTNKVTLLGPGNRLEELPLLSKRRVAEHILDRLEELLKGRNTTATQEASI